MPHYLSAQEVCERLGVKEATLYAYVSRGLIRSEVESQTSRKRRYLTEDVDKLMERKEQRRDPAKVVEDALHWGVPLLDSAITMITDNHLYFRGQNAADLAQSQSLESVAALIWLDDLNAASDLFGQPVLLPDSLPLFHAMERGSGGEDGALPAMPALQIALTLASTRDFAAYDLTPMGVARTGARILKHMTAALISQLIVGTGYIPSASPHASSLADTLAAAWSPDAAYLLNAAMVLCADHELNVSSFTARVVASAESNPYAVVQAGLSALQGFKHGGQSTRVTAFIREVDQLERVQMVIGERLRRGDDLPGFGHPLYPEGDPRAKALMDMLITHQPDSPALALSLSIAESLYKMTGGLPTIDFALATLERVLSLPDGSALALFALGRTVGWLGHAIEQYHSSQLIRPRARYVGRPPTT